MTMVQSRATSLGIRLKQAFMVFVLWPITMQFAQFGIVYAWVAGVGGNLLLALAAWDKPRKMSAAWPMFFIAVAICWLVFIIIHYIAG